MMKQNCFVCKIVCAFVLLGALNWGLVGFFGLDLVAHFLGVASTATRVVYCVIGICALIKIISCFKDCPACKK